MQTAGSRLAYVLSFCLTASMALYLAITLSSVIHFVADSGTQIEEAVSHIKLTPSSIETSKMRPKHLYDRQTKNIASLTFDLGADLEPLFDWNTKQLFVYLVATYSSPKFSSNEVVIWHKILKSKSEGLLRLNNLKSMVQDYQFFDRGSNSFEDVNVKLSLHWDTMPYVGYLVAGHGAMSRSIGTK